MPIRHIKLTHFRGKIVQCATHGSPAVECVDWPPEICYLELTLVQFTQKLAHKGLETSEDMCDRKSITCMPIRRFSGLISLWITCFPWQYMRARANDATYCAQITVQRSALNGATEHKGIQIILHSNKRQLTVAARLSLKYLHFCNSLYSSPFAAYSSIR